MTGICISLTELFESLQRPKGGRMTGAWLHAILACSSLSCRQK